MGGYNVQGKTNAISATCNWIVNGNNNAITGMTINSLSKLDVLNNNVTLPSVPSANSNAFKFENLNNSTIRQNGAQGNIGYSTGYLFSISGNNLINNNSSDNLKTGFDFWNVCVGTSFISNYINNHYTGLHLNSTALLGPQTDNGNRWVPYGQGGGFGSGYGAIHDAPTQSLILSSKFVTTGVAPTVFNPTYNTPNVSAIWFFNTGVGPESIPFISCGRYNIYSTERISFIDSLVVKDGISSYDFEEGLKWMTQSSLMDKLIKDSIALYSNELFSAYFDSVMQTQNGKLAEVRYAMSKLYDDAVDVEARLAVNDSTIQSLLNLKAENDSLLQIGLNFSDSLRIENLNLTYLQRLNELKAENNVILTYFYYSRLSRISELIYLNSIVSPENILESNEKNVNSIYLNHIARDSMSISDNEKSILHEIANQCPFSGGKSVYKARFILNLLGDSTGYNDEEYCTYLGYRKGKEDKSIELLAYPNPANETSTILLSVEKHAQLTLTIYDVSGRALNNFIIPENQQKFTFKTIQFSDGIYDLELSGKGIKNLHSKLLIAR